MIPLSAQTRFENWLAASGLKSKVCPSCGGTSWNGGSPVALVKAELHAGGWMANIGSAAKFAVALECTGCGLILTWAMPAQVP